jgi:hypothetical protein
MEFDRLVLYNIPHGKDLRLDAIIILFIGRVAKEAHQVDTELPYLILERKFTLEAPPMLKYWTHRGHGDLHSPVRTATGSSLESFCYQKVIFGPLQ